MTQSNLVTPWNPLEVKNEADANILAAAQKREIKNILKSYVGNYDPLSEILQNAMDAIEKRFGDSKDKLGKIQIYINLKENSIEVVDNGCGFEESEFKSFLAPSISFKSGDKTRGNKGVGVTYIAYGFNHLTIRTKSEHFSYEGELRRGREWVEDLEGTIPAPLIETTSSSSDAFNDIDQGSSFKIRFWELRNLAWYQARTAAQWLYILLIKTPLGSINLPDCRSSNIHFDLHVTDEKGQVTSEESIPAMYKFPHLEIKASPKLRKIVDAEEAAVSKSKDPSEAIRGFKKSNGIYEVFSNEDIINLIALDDREEQLAKNHKVTAYGYFVYSTEVWRQLNDKKAQLRKSLRIIRGGLQLASNGMPQGEMITIPLKKNIGHQNQCHVIVHFEGAEPDLGRKGFQPELKELAERISVGVVKKLSARRDGILKSDSGAHADIDKEKQLHEWLKYQEAHEEKSPLVLKSEKFFLPTRKISVMCIPQTEQDVIVLFSQLIAGGVIRGLKILTTSQSTQYDGVFKFAADEPLPDYIYDKTTNPLGVHEEQLIKPYVTPPKVVEYKFSLDGLIRDFEAEEKREGDVDLAVFWEMGTEFWKEYEVTSYLDEEKTHHRMHHGLTHKLTFSNSSYIEVICLKELFQLLNEPEEAQKHQVSEYGLDI